MTKQHPHKKYDFPVHKIRRFLETGPIVLVSSRYKGETNIMIMGWHTILEFSPSLVGCMITSANYSYDLIRKSKACVINIPTQDMIKTVIGIGNCTGRDTDKFETFGLTRKDALKVDAPLIAECPVNIECRLHDGRMLKDYNFFIFEAVKAHAPRTPKYPKTLHYTGDGVFMMSGGHRDLHRQFKKQNL